MVTSADVERIFRDVGALREGHFLLSSGKHSSMYLEKFWVLQWPKKTELLCGGIVERIRDERIATVAGPTTGGIILAHEVARQLGVRAVYAEREERGSARVFRRGFQIAREERTWHGRVLGSIPYDFRVPTLDRLREAYWDPETDRVFSERVFGVGWAVNIPVAARKISEIVSHYADASARLRADAQSKLRRGDDEP